MAKQIAVALILVVICAATLLAQQRLDNDSVIKMVKAGLSEDVIVSAITNQPGSYQLDADHLIDLKTAGVPDKVMAAMVARNSGAAMAPSNSGAASAPLVDEIGIYFKNGDNWVEMYPEVVNFKSGGVLKRMASEGIVKGDINGHLEGKTAKTSVTTPLDFLIYMPDGVAITEYQLLRLRVGGSSREFRSITGGVFHSSGGAQRDEVSFEAKKLAPRTYEIVLPAGFRRGEYGFLPPGAVSSSNMASSGKMYTFQVLE